MLLRWSFFLRVPNLSCFNCLRLRKIHFRTWAFQRLFHLLSLLVSEEVLNLLFLDFLQLAAPIFHKLAQGIHIPPPFCKWRHGYRDPWQLGSLGACLRLDLHVNAAPINPIAKNMKAWAGASGAIALHFCSPTAPSTYCMSPRSLAHPDPPGTLALPTAMRQASAIAVLSSDFRSSAEEITLPQGASGLLFPLTHRKSPWTPAAGAAPSMPSASLPQKVPAPLAGAGSQGFASPRADLFPASWRRHLPHCCAK